LPSNGWVDIVRRFTQGCRRSGFDLSGSLPVGAYNEGVASVPRLPDFGRARSLAVVIGSTRAFWPPFRAALRNGEVPPDEENPVERFTTARLRRAADETGAGYDMRFAHETGPRIVAIQRLAELAGLAWLAPSNLSIHPVYGPWIALRAVAVFDVEGPTKPPARVEDPCGACVQACGPAFHRALHGDLSLASEPWRLWVAVRDACPLGRTHRYDEDQIVYHYAKDRSVLRRAARPKASDGARGSKLGE
jgi:cyanocobalamin reductase (cyanide-eliminating) / alkylcobalamin dealkylase